MNRHVTIAAFALGCMPLAGCFFEDHHYDRGGYYGPGPSAPVMSIPACPSNTAPAGSVMLDTGEALTTAVGEGTGVFVEYKAGGHWHIWASCDTKLTGYGCAYDVTAQVFGGSVSNLLGEDLESQDFSGSQCADTAYLSVNTGSNVDGLLFDAPAGAPIRVTAALDSALRRDLIYWIGGGVPHNDGTTNPLDFTPSTP